MAPLALPELPNLIREQTRPEAPNLKVAEDAWTLYGFAHADERAVFRLLIGVQGVSARVAVAILSVLAPGTLRRAVQEGDLDALTAVTGVGKKIAQRILVDRAHGRATSLPLLGVALVAQMQWTAPERSQ